MIAEDELGVIESFGKFNRVVHPGPVALSQPCGVAAETLRTRIDTRVRQQVNIQLRVFKTKED